MTTNQPNEEREEFVRWYGERIGEIGWDALFPLWKQLRQANAELEEVKEQKEEVWKKVLARDEKIHDLGNELSELRAKVKRLTAAAEGVVWRERAEGLKFGDDVVIDSLESVLKAQSEGTDQ